MPKFKISGNLNSWNYSKQLTIILLYDLLKTFFLIFENDEAETSDNTNGNNDAEGYNDSTSNWDW